MKKSILITGCSSGIGYDAAKTMHARGWNVVAACRKQSDCLLLRKEGFQTVQLDYADDSSITSGLNETLSLTGGRLDAVFNNGAFAIPGAVEDLPRAALQSIFETNLFGVHELTRQIIPIMRKQGFGRIINCSSVLGYTPIKWRGAYVASKHALEGLSDVLRLEMADTGIKVILIAPGPITSKIRENAIPHFERHIDWRASARRAEYETSLLKRLYESRGPDPFELPPAAVSKALIQATEGKRPKPRYYVTKPAYVMKIAGRLLSTRMMDRIIRLS